MPKSVDLHQAITFLKGILENHQNKAWNHSVQDRMGSYLAKNGATRSGKNVTPQRLRTMMAGLPQFFGFVFKNENTTPTSISVSEVGKKLIKTHANDLESYSAKNLKLGREDPYKITSSNIFLLQFKKLQFTNPIIHSECENIFNFPLEITLLLLKKTGYLSKAEISMFLFKIKTKDEVPYYAEQINNFRNLSLVKKHGLIDAFTTTKLGSKALKKAATSGYFIALCLMTNFFKKIKTVDKTLHNYEQIRLVIDNDASKEINSYLNKMENIEPYDFGKDLTLWIDYFGNPETLYVPKNYKITNNSSEDIYIQAKRGNHLVLEQALESASIISFPILQNQTTKIKIFNIRTHNVILRKDIDWDQEHLSISNDDINEIVITSTDDNFLILKSKIEDHISSTTFDSDFINKLSFLENITNRNLISSKHLRGSRLEHLFYKAMKKKLEEIANPTEFELIWLGKLDKDGLPTAAPGGIHGCSDLKLYFKNLQIIFELTTIKPKSGQEKAEAISVPDHIKNHRKEKPDLKTIGVYLAPIIHNRISSIFESNMKNYPAELYSYEIEAFLDRLDSVENLDELGSFLIELNLKDNS